MKLENKNKIDINREVYQGIYLHEKVIFRTTSFPIHTSRYQCESDQSHSYIDSTGIFANEFRNLDPKNEIYDHWDILEVSSKVNPIHYHINNKKARYQVI